MKALLFLILFSCSFSSNAKNPVSIESVAKSFRKYFDYNEIDEIGYENNIFPTYGSDLSYKILDKIDDLWFNLSDNNHMVVYANKSNETWLIDNSIKTGHPSLFILVNERKIEGYIALLSYCDHNGCIKNQGVLYLDQNGDVVKLYMN